MNELAWHEVDGYSAFPRGPYCKAHFILVQNSPTFQMFTGINPASPSQSGWISSCRVLAHTSMLRDFSTYVSRTRQPKVSAETPYYRWSRNPRKILGSYHRQVEFRIQRHRSERCQHNQLTLRPPRRSLSLLPPHLPRTHFENDHSLPPALMHTRHQTFLQGCDT